MKTGRLMLNGGVFADPVEIASGFFERLRGLLGRDRLPDGAAMVIENCGSVHTIGMRFALDLLFLDKNWRVVSIKRDVKPGRPMVCGGLRASRVIESRAGGLNLCGAGPGDQLTFIPVGG